MYSDLPKPGRKIQRREELRPTKLFKQVVYPRKRERVNLRDGIETAVVHAESVGTVLLPH